MRNTIRSKDNYLSPFFFHSREIVYWQHKKTFEPSPINSGQFIEQFATFECFWFDSFLLLFLFDKLTSYEINSANVSIFIFMMIVEKWNWNSSACIGALFIRCTHRSHTYANAYAHAVWTRGTYTLPWMKKFAMRKFTLPIIECHFYVSTRLHTHMLHLDDRNV